MHRFSIKKQTLRLPTLKSIYSGDVIKAIQVFLWACCVFCYFFQFPFRGLASLIVPFFFLFFVSEEKNLKISADKGFVIALVCFFLYLDFSWWYSIFRGIEGNRSLRFIEILCMIPMCLFIKDEKFETEIKVLVFFACLKSLVLIGIAIYLFAVGSHSVIRNWVFSINGGDIYFDGWRPKIQVQGNGIIPFAFMLHTLLIKEKNKVLNFVSLILLAGSFFAGNFAFVLCIACFFCYGVYKFLLSYKNRRGYYTPLILLFVLVALPFVYKYIDKQKEEKAQFSNVVREEQASFLLNTNPVIGAGLGNHVYGTGTVTSYDGESLYFEMQSLYIYNQIGLVGMTLFYLVILFYFGKTSKVKLTVFLIYLFYTFWNPYCFDTTEMIAVVSLMNIKTGNNTKRLIETGNK